MFLENLEILCKKRGLSISGFAKKIGLSSGSVAWWKRGSIPHEDNLQKIAEYFNITVEELLSERDNPARLSTMELDRLNVDFEKWRKNWNRKLDLQKEEPNKAVKLILENLMSVINKYGRFSPEAKIAVDTAIDSSIGAILAILEEKNLHIETLKANLGMAESSLIEKDEIIDGLIEGKKLDDILKELCYISPKKDKEN